MKHLLLFIGLISFTQIVFGQSTLQNIKGTVIDKQSQQSMPGVLVQIVETNPVKMARTDVDGKFKITDISPGRYSLKFNYAGSKEVVISNVVVSSGKETMLDISIEENVSELGSVTVNAKKKTMNQP
jgi:hypothetical protein